MRQGLLFGTLDGVSIGEDGILRAMLIDHGTDPDRWDADRILPDQVPITFQMDRRPAMEADGSWSINNEWIPDADAASALVPWPAWMRDGTGVSITFHGDVDQHGHAPVAVIAMRTLLGAGLEITALTVGHENIP